MSTDEYSAEERELLLSTAYRSIEYGVIEHRSPRVDPAEFAPHLREWRACFVTLHRDGELRGCTGSIAARRPVIVDVSEHAYTSAFRDVRFPPVALFELDGLEISISVLSAPELLSVSDEQELIERLRPGVDGVILQEGDRLATLLPSVWESLPDPVEFLRQLKRKAGLPPDYWSRRIRVSRYRTEQFP